mgnify:CR=1 FL=1|tara:strand:+ start:65 stop:265 length:201 start_codon:yes stop_codon:yes gene_type:complete
MIKTYQITFKEYEKDESQTMQVKTKDIDYTIVQLGRNRSIETISYKELNNVNYDEDIQGPNGNLGI